ncbi:hypothetical protein [Bradyrhizobium sp. AUGA SZCCT0283]|uniref:hypothetical protein n=1 Tax=Bradyrhizobium sp. AUGA SZCCT0283 TaxID=2807671 RepID=UPI001BAE4AEE|nr:hypothetical protein [Bradyrhizobium sp. AUGA SZCCT0283]MBR1280322.1 hypothetical protein [Bradyrhizobium sp. AUGA SZCCT0283]
MDWNGFLNCQALFFHHGSFQQNGEMGELAMANVGDQFRSLDSDRLYRGEGDGSH